MPPATTTHHDPTPFLTFAPNPSPRRALILLNQPIAANNAFRRCFGAAEWHVVADGAADRLLDWVRLDGRRTLLEVQPDLIVGDLDSISADALHAFQVKKVPVAHDGSEYTTDFGKAITAVRALRRLGGRSSLRDIVRAPAPRHESGALVLEDLIARILAHAKATEGSANDGSKDGGGEDDQPGTELVLFSSLGGRVDQGIGVLSEMARERDEAMRRDAGAPWTFWLVSERSVSLVLDGPDDGAPDKGVPAEGVSDAEGGKRRTRHHTLHLDRGLFSPNVGILPVFGPARIWTTGLEWDVQDWETRMGGQVSTSNHIVAEDGIVCVETTGRVLFTVEMGDVLIK